MLLLVHKVLTVSKMHTYLDRSLAKIPLHVFTHVKFWTSDLNKTENLYLDLSNVLKYDTYHT